MICCWPQFEKGAPFERGLLETAIMLAPDRARTFSSGRPIITQRWWRPMYSLAFVFVFLAALALVGVGQLQPLPRQRPADGSMGAREKMVGVLFDH